MSDIEMERVDEWRLRIPSCGSMRTGGVVYADERLERDIRGDGSIAQVANVARLPGIVGSSMAMPDVHLGYGFPIGGVAAFDVREGVVSPGGVGYDINCGVRLLTSGIGRGDLEGALDVLADAVATRVPAGVGSKRTEAALSRRELADVLEGGMLWAESKGYTRHGDRAHVESEGVIEGADAARVGDRALERGLEQLGTLGSGNHFVEVGYVHEVHDEDAARAMGLDEGGVTVLVHTGSRGLGHQVCTDHLKRMPAAAREHGIELPDRQLACVPVDSEQGRDYLAAMAAAANFAFVNRQVLAYWVREAFQHALGASPSDLRMDLVYDVAHNIAKIETHGDRRLCVHRKGATRAFPPGHPEVPEDYRSVGQPVLIPGDMGRCSHVLVGTQRAMDDTFGSTCHGAGRMMSRKQAKKRAKGRAIRDELEQRGIRVRSAGRATLAEEMSEAYKDVDDVVRVVEGAGLCRRVARLRPLVVVKG